MSHWPGAAGPPGTSSADILSSCSPELPPAGGCGRGLGGASRGSLYSGGPPGCESGICPSAVQTGPVQALPLALRAGSL